MIKQAARKIIKWKVHNYLKASYLKLTLKNYKNKSPILA